MKERSQSQQRMGMVLVVVLLVSGSLLLWRGLQGTASMDRGAEKASPVVSDGAGTPQQATPALGPVTPGEGVYTKDAPQTTSPSTVDALCAGCDVVLVTVCSLRKDHLGTFGASSTISPAVDGVAEGAFRFDRAYAASNFTLASLTAILTGRFGTATGVTGWDKGLTKDVPTLPEVLGVYGYNTAGFTTDAPSGFRPDYGLDRGFQHLEITAAPRNSPDGRWRGGEKEPLGAAATPAIEWLEEQSTDKPIFLMLHTRTAHFPFVVDPPEDGTDPTKMKELLWEAGRKDANARTEQAMPGMAGGTAQQGIVKIVRQDPLQTQVNVVGQPAVDVWADEYAKAVTRMDADVLALLTALERRGRMNKTMFILVADHGESLNDHGELLHGDAFFDGVINVPLIMKIPDLSAPSQTTDMLVSQVDILPTILDVVGAIAPSGIDGVSLLPYLQGTEEGSPHDVVLSEGGVARQEGPDMPGAVIAPPWLLMKQQRGCPEESAGMRFMDGSMPVCLFHMDNDPEQTQSKAAVQQEVVQGLLERWNGFREAHGQRESTRELSPEFIEELRRSGYDFSTGVP
ncbi:MAG: sulfatase [Myxococcota bacterium]